MSDDTTPEHVHIKLDSPTHCVDITAPGSPSDVEDMAVRLMDYLTALPVAPPRAVGFAVTERRDSQPAQASSIRHLPHPYPIQAEDNRSTVEALHG